MVSLTKPLSIEKKPHLRDFSFSSYLNPSEEAYLRKLAETSKVPNSTVTIQIENVNFGEMNVGYGEIGVFGAEKYFNEGDDEEYIDHPKGQFDQIVNQFRRPSVQSQTSWNSHSALLQGDKRKLIRNKSEKRRQGKGLLSILSCDCSCGGENSVDINEYKSQSFSKRNYGDGIDLDRNFKSLIMEEIQLNKIRDFGPGLKQEDCFTFPTTNQNSENLKTKKLVFQEEEDDKKRKSLEVFGSLFMEKRDETIFDKKLDIFARDTGSRREEIEFPSNSDGNFDDIGSDTSSDLFEIESLSTYNNSNSFLVRQTSNASGCCETPTSCYAPSEASIEWSVVTASAADFSFLSESSFREVEKTVKYKKGKEVEKKRSGILSGCKSQKTVRVAGDAYRTRIKERAKV